MCHHCFGCNPKCTERHDGRPPRIPPIKCPACGRANRAENLKCKICGSDLPNYTLESTLTPSECLYTGMMCENTCSLAKVINKKAEAAQCPSKL